MIPYHNGNTDSGEKEALEIMCEYHRVRGFQAIVIERNLQNASCYFSTASFDLSQ